MKNRWEKIARFFPIIQYCIFREYRMKKRCFVKKTSYGIFFVFNTYRYYESYLNNRYFLVKK